jgi:hypothetical protein
MGRMKTKEEKISKKLARKIAKGHKDAVRLKGKMIG